LKVLKPSGSYYGEFCTQRFDTGAANDADSTPTATANKNGTDDGSFTLTVTKIDTGRYKITGTVPNGYSAGDIVVVTVAATVNSVAGKGVVDQFQVVTARPGTDDIPIEDAVLASSQPSYAPSKAGDAMTLTGAYDAAKSAASQTSVNTVDGIADAIKAKTDNLPSDPADESQLEAAITAAHATTNGKIDAVDTIIDNIHDTDLPAVKSETAAIKAKTDNLPASPAAVGSKMDIVDSPSSTGLGAIVSAIWAALTSGITTTGSIGKLIKDYLDAAVSSRLASTGYIAPPSVGAIADQVHDELLSGHTAAGSAGKALSDAMALSVAAIDAQLSGTHGAGAWGASAVGTIAYPDPLDPFLDENRDPMSGVKIEAFSNAARTALVDVQVTDVNGNFQFHLNAGEYWFRASLLQHVSYEWSEMLA